MIPCLCINLEALIGLRDFLCLCVSMEVAFLRTAGNVKRMTKREIVKAIVDCFDRGGKLIIFGNGGSMAEASHFATEFIGINKSAVVLSDASTITALANDFGYENVFATWVNALGTNRDLLIGISSSGKSKNIKVTFKDQKWRKIPFIDFPRKGKSISEIQNNQLKLMHKIYGEIKEYYADNK